MVFKSTDNPNCPEIYDSERNIRLKRIGGIGRGVDQFELDWNGNIIKFDAYGKEGVIEKSRPLSIEWLIHCFTLPPELKNTESRRDAMSLMEEALKSYGYDAKTDWNGTSTVDFAPEIER